MNESLSETCDFHVVRSTAGARRYQQDPPQERPVGRVPRISKMMALAIRFETLIREGVVANQAELAELAMVSRARVTQIMNLLNLAPAIQEELLFLPRVERGKDQLHLKGMLPIAGEVSWERQLASWRKL